MVFPHTWALKKCYKTTLQKEEQKKPPDHSWADSLQISRVPFIFLSKTVQEDHLPSRKQSCQREEPTPAPFILLAGGNFRPPPPPGDRGSARVCRRAHGPRDGGGSRGGRGGFLTSSASEPVRLCGGPSAVSPFLSISVAQLGPEGWGDNVKMTLEESVFSLLVCCPAIIANKCQNAGCIF